MAKNTFRQKRGAKKRNQTKKRNQVKKMRAKKMQRGGRALYHRDYNFIANNPKNGILFIPTNTEVESPSYYLYASGIIGDRPSSIRGESQFLIKYTYLMHTKENENKNETIVVTKNIPSFDVDGSLYSVLMSNGMTHIWSLATPVITLISSFIISHKETLAGFSPASDNPTELLGNLYNVNIENAIAKGELTDDSGLYLYQYLLDEEGIQIISFTCEYIDDFKKCEYKRELEIQNKIKNFGMSEARARATTTEC